MRLTNHPLTAVLATTAVAFGFAACDGGDDSEALASDAPAETVDPMADETAYGFDDIDMDGDSELDADEIHEWMEGPILAYYMQTDVDVVEDPTAPDQTGMLDPVVLIDALYAAWDVDDSGSLDETEWDLATRVIESVSDTEAAWIEFDVDGNDLVAIDEVRAQLDDDAVLAAIDSDEDGRIEDEEMNDWFFALFDVDGNDRVSRDEWRVAEHYFDIPIL